MTNQYMILYFLVRGVVDVVELYEPYQRFVSVQVRQTRDDCKSKRQAQ